MARAKPKAAPPTFSPKQEWGWWQLERPDKTRFLFDGGGRSGKTWLICKWMVKEALVHPGSRQLIARRIRQAAKKTIFDNTLSSMLSRMECAKPRRDDLSWVFGNGSIIRVDGLDDEQRMMNVLGDDFLHIFLNEATQMSYRAMEYALTRLSQVLPGDPPHKLIVDCNPRGPRHWVHRVGIENVHPETMAPLPDREWWYRLNWTPLDNPFLSDDVIRTYASFSGTHRRQMLEGAWCEAEGSVYEEFDDAVHLFGELPKGFDGWTRILGIDFGFTNPFVCLWGAVDPDGALWIYRELYKTNLLVSEAAVEIKRMTKNDPSPRVVVADHDAEDRATLNKCGIRTKRAKKDVITGINKVKERLKVGRNGKPRLYVHHGCHNLIHEMYEYVWEEGHGGLNAKEQPKKKDDHAQDALRYMVMELDGPAGAGMVG